MDPREICDCNRSPCRCDNQTAPTVFTDGAPPKQLQRQPPEALAGLSDKTKFIAGVIGRLASTVFLRDLPHFIEELGGEKALLKRLAGMDLSFNFQLVVTELPEPGRRFNSEPGQEAPQLLPPMDVLIEVEKEVFE